MQEAQTIAISCFYLIATVFYFTSSSMTQIDGLSYLFWLIILAFTILVIVISLNAQMRNRRTGDRPKFSQNILRAWEKIKESVKKLVSRDDNNQISNINSAEGSTAKILKKWTPYNSGN